MEKENLNDQETDSSENLILEARAEFDRNPYEELFISSKPHSSNTL